MDIRFPGGLRVDALHEGFWVRTDQPAAAGGTGAAPSPFDLFLASIGTCSGFYALSFCRQRNLDTEGLALTLSFERGAKRRHIARIRIEIALPADFPEKYHDALLRAVDQCAVKRHILEPPVFEIVTTRSSMESESPDGLLDGVWPGSDSPESWPLGWPG
ncbi:MAG TPA: OsmC family protein [Thermoanaerobaculia bacterium]|nr:OsmC family protein [Thermoanaerobaculia bacterium]